MSRPYGYTGRPAGSPAVRLTARARLLVETLILLAVVAACWTATLLLPHYADRFPMVDPQTHTGETR